MHKSLVFAWICVICWSFLPNILERKLDGFHPASILVLVYSVMLSLAFVRLGHVKYMGEPVHFPTGIFLTIAVGTAFLWFVGDYSYTSAFLSQGSLVAIMTILALSPIGATLVKMVWAGELPNRYHIVAYVAVLIAIYFTAKGNTIANSVP